VVPVPLLALSLLLDGPHAVGEGLVHLGWRGGVSTLYTVVMSTLVAYGIFNTLLARHASHRVVPWILLVPPVAMASAWALRDEVPNAAEIGGAVLLILGVLIAQGVLRLRARAASEVGAAALGEGRAAAVRTR